MMNYLPHTIVAAAICVIFKQWLSSASVPNKYVRHKSYLVSKQCEGPNWQGGGFVSPVPGNEQNVPFLTPASGKQKNPAS